MSLIKDPQSRRDMLRSTVAASGLAIAMNVGLAPIAQSQAPGPVRVRKNIYGLSSNEWDSFIKGVTVMKGRASSDPTSWLYQANMHGTYDTPALNLWNTCQHGSFFFLSWHRMYIYFFERIMRAASSDTSFNLPYWDYETASQRVMPEKFRLPALPSNVLYVKERSNVNAGTPLAASTVSASQALATTNFDAGGNDPSFGGRTVAAPQHFGSGAGRLERQPHNVVHVAIGGGGGWMSDPNLAARDPIFWVHHCNIDRLWAKWNALGGGRQDPSSGDWPTQVFKFYDEAGTVVELTGAQVVNTALELGYRYEDVQQMAQFNAEVSRNSQPRPPSRSEPRVLATSGAGSGLGLGARTASITLQPSANEVRGLESSTVEPTTILFDDVSFKGPVGIYYEVYLNKPDGTAFDPEGPYFAGNLSFFALGHSHSGDGAVTDASTTVDIGSLLTDQRKARLWSGRDVRVELHPQSGGTVDPNNDRTFVSIGQVKLLGR